MGLWSQKRSLSYFYRLKSLYNEDLNNHINTDERLELFNDLLIENFTINLNNGLILSSSKGK